jgi:hypothetical protein
VLRIGLRGGSKRKKERTRIKAAGLRGGGGGGRKVRKERGKLGREEGIGPTGLEFLFSISNFF